MRADHRDWFERLTGFREIGFDETRSRLEIRERRLYSLATDQNYAVGELELPSLQELRARSAAIQLVGRLRVTNTSGNVREMHQESSGGACDRQQGGCCVPGGAQRKNSDAG